jgi:hypothetical protein
LLGIVTIPFISTRFLIFFVSLVQKIEGAIAIGYRALFVLIRKVFEAFRFNSILA